MKKIVALVLSLIMVLSLAGCGEAGKAEEAVKNLFEAFKAGNFEEAESYLVKDEAEETADDEDVEMFNHVFTKVDYEIVSSEKIDGENVNVTASVTAPDMKVAVGEFFTKALEFAFANAFSETPMSDEESEAEMKRIFIEATDKEDLGTVTNEIVIAVCKTDEGWKVNSDETFVDAVTGGMMAALQDMESSMMEGIEE